ncbi:hypothetical protein DSL72_002220 [Monilinia vaccinii-corymbosi]|uniref:BTB domain-containing protein n=1 Tax=Monilinia vaccinii-corymbosi TaxID=61207 RepID=A0A8A3PC17_9HELO|nr:hypothetical protein DSL72_002220 [Monilinia vaccinii-corymbosi]
MKSRSKPAKNASLFSGVPRALNSNNSDDKPAQRVKTNEDMTSKKRKAKEIVTLLVGNDPESKASRFIVHKKLLCAASPVFEAACKPEWQGAEKDVIRLPEYQPEVIRAFVHWVYYDKYIYLSLKDFETRALADRPEGVLVRLYFLGDKYQMPRLRNQMIDALTSYRLQEGGYALETLDYACKNTAKGSALRSYLATTAICVWCHGYLSSLDEKLYPELFHDIAIQLIMAREEEVRCEDSEYGHDDEDAPSFCDRYHTHEPGSKILCTEDEIYRDDCWMSYGSND